MFEDGVSYNEMSTSDLIFELKRMKQKHDILEQNKAIYLQEQELKMESQSNSSDALMVQCNKQSARIQQLQSIVTSLFGKYSGMHFNFTDVSLFDHVLFMSLCVIFITCPAVASLTNMLYTAVVVLRNIQLERQALSEIRVDCLKFGDTYMSSNFREMVVSEMSGMWSAHEKSSKDKLDAANRRVMTLETEGMALKVANFEQGSKILTLEGELNSLSKKLSENASHLESENNLLSKHNAEITGKLMDLNYKMEQMETFFRNDLETVVNEKNAEILAVTSENTALKQQIESLTGAISKANNDYCILKANNEITLENTVTGLTSKHSKELAGNQTTISNLNEQVANLFELNEKLQADFNGILKREEMLRKERQNDGKDTSDLKSRLFQVQSKLREIEADTNNEISSLSRQLEEANSQCQQARHDCHVAEQASKQLDGLLISSREKVVELTKNLADMQSNLEQMCESLSQELSDEKRKNSSHNIQMKTMQQSNDDFQKRVNQLCSQLESLKAKGKEFDLYKNAAEDEKEVLRSSITELRSENSVLKANSTKVHGEQEKVKSLEKTVAELKMCIHKECEERTDMLIQLSELREEIKRLRADRNSIGCGGLDGGADDRGNSMITSEHSGSDPAESSRARKMNNYPTLPNGASGLGRTNSLRSGQGPDTDIQPLLSNTGGGGGALESEDTESNKIWSQKFKKPKPVGMKGRR